MILENKLNITDQAELARAEEKISKARAKKMFETEYLDTLEPGTFETLKMIHKYLFEEIYEFAGQLRKVNIAKGNFRFTSRTYLEEAIKNIEKMPQSTYEEIIEKYKNQTYNQLANGYEMTNTMNNAKQSIMNALDSYCNRRDNSLFDVTYDLKEKANMSQSDYMELKDLAHNLRDYAKVNASWPTKLAWKIEDLKNKLFNKNKPLQITDGNNKNSRAESFDSAKKDNMPNVLAQTPTKINRNNEPARNDFAPKAEPVTTEEINAILNRMNRQNQQGINHDIGSK